MAFTATIMKVTEEPEGPRVVYSVSDGANEYGPFMEDIRDGSDPVDYVTRRSVEIEASINSEAV